MDEEFDPDADEFVFVKRKYDTQVSNYRDLKIQKDLIENRNKFQNKVMPRIFVICTGGTFCSVMTPQGYIAERGVINRLRLFKSLYDEDFSKQYGCADDENITPITPFKRRIFWKLHELDVFLDSANMSMNDHVFIAQKIFDEYYNYDGFIVIHGTDTICYTASTLSFILENLNKPIILTGSQIPILELKNDAVDNFLGSLLFAGEYSIPEVMVCFGNELLRGNRARKVSTN